MVYLIASAILILKAFIANFHSMPAAAGGGVGGGGHALLPAAAVPGQLGRQQGGQEGQGGPHCTVLYCTVSPAQGDRSTKQLEVEVEDKQEIGDFSESYFKGHKNFNVKYFFSIKYFHKKKIFLLFETIRPKQNMLQRGG